MEKETLGIFLKDKKASMEVLRKEAEEVRCYSLSLSLKPIHCVRISIG